MWCSNKRLGQIEGKMDDLTDAVRLLHDDVTTIKAQVGPIYDGWHNGGSPACKRVGAKLDLLVKVAGGIVVLGCGVIGWIVSQL